MVSFLKYSIFLITLFFSFQNLFAQDEEILNAMRSEITRSLEKLKLDNLDKPYYIEYKVILYEPQTVKAVLGSLVSSDERKTASLSVDLRIGDYKFDNTNFFDVGLSFFGSSDDEERFKRRSIPIELDYQNLRRELWLATDAAYKQSNEIYSKKISSMQNRTRLDTTPDFIQIPKRTTYTKDKLVAVSQKEIEAKVKIISDVFNKYSDIYSSSVGIEYLPKRIYYVNSEGIEYIKNEFYTGLEVVAFLKTQDGMPLANYYTAYSDFPKDLPTNDSLIIAAQKVASNLLSTLNSKELEDSYSGPVIFEGEAATQTIAQIFAPNLIAQRNPLTESGVLENDRDMAFQNKVGARVLPEFLSLKMNPNQKKYENTELIGHFELDDEGLTPKEFELVKNGYLKTLISSRVPTKRIKQSAGHSRGGAAMFSNLELFSVEKKKVLNDKQLKDKLIQLCKDRELPFGIIVRKVMDKNLMFTTLFSLSKGDYEVPRGTGKLAVAEIYKVYPNGKEEIFKGVSINGLSVQSFKDIIAVGSKSYAMNYLAPAVISPFYSGGDQYISTSIISPSLLFEDVEIKVSESDYTKPPFLSNPLGIK